MKHLFFTLCVMLFAIAMQAQNGSKYSIELRTGIQKVDERSLFEEDQLNRFANNYLGIVAQRKIIGIGKSNRFSAWAGLSIGQEQQNFNRVITSDWCRFCVLCGCFSLGSPTSLNSYQQYQAGIPLAIQYNIAERWSLRLEYRPDFVFHKQAKGNEGAKWNGFELLDHNFRPSISYQLGRCQIGLAANLRTGRELDPFYYEQFLQSGLTQEFAPYFDFGDYRPLRLDLSVGYSW